MGKPVVASQAATLRHALRAVAITDRVEGYGRFLNTRIPSRSTTFS